MPAERDLLKAIWTNFRNSLRPRQWKGNLVGKDRFGNQFFEIPANPSIGKRKAARYFKPPGEELQNFDSQMPAEWESWLRGRRDVPPTEEELLSNQAVAEMKKKNAAELEGQRAKPGGGDTPQLGDGIQGFPSYPEYHVGDPNDPNLKR